jgi:hypothetical protein
MIGETILKVCTLPRVGVASTLATGWACVAAIELPDFTTFEKFGLPGLVIGFGAVVVWLTIRQRGQEVRQLQAAYEKMISSHAATIAIKEGVNTKRHEEVLELTRTTLSAMHRTAESTDKLAESIRSMANATHELRRDCHGKLMEVRP